MPTLIDALTPYLGQPLAAHRGDPGWRCVGLVLVALQGIGLLPEQTPETVRSSDLKAALTPVDEPEVGDVVFFNPGGDPSAQNVCGILTNLTPQTMLGVQSGKGVAEYRCDSGWHALHRVGYWRVPA